MLGHGEGDNRCGDKHKNIEEMSGYLKIHT